jgi:predicted neuraminidase
LEETQMSEKQFSSEMIIPDFLYQKHLYPIDSIPERPQCHAANIIVGKSSAKEITLFCVWFAGSHEGNLDVSILFSEITYEPKSDPKQIKFKYSTPRVVASHPDRACGNPVLFLDPNSILHLWVPAFWPRESGNTFHDRKIYHKASKDFGQSWSEPQVFSDRSGLWVKNPLLVLQNGTWLLPMNDEARFNWKTRTYWSSRFAFSHDQGKTWEFSPLYSIHKGMIQPCVVQFPNGELFCLNRSRTGWLVEMHSFDNGQTWSKAKNTDIPNNNACACMTQLKNGTLVMAFNPLQKGRNILSIAVSRDQGHHWIQKLNLENEDSMEFSYPCILETPDGLIHVAYTYKRRTISHSVFRI